MMFKKFSEMPLNGLKKRIVQQDITFDIKWWEDKGLCSMGIIHRHFMWTLLLILETSLITLEYKKYLSEEYEILVGFFLNLAVFYKASQPNEWSLLICIKFTSVLLCSSFVNSGKFNKVKVLMSSRKRAIFSFACI